MYHGICPKFSQLCFTAQQLWKFQRIKQLVLELFEGGFSVFNFVYTYSAVSEKSGANGRVGNFQKKNLVELGGIEPPTSTLPVSRSPS